MELGLVKMQTGAIRAWSRHHNWWQLPVAYFRALSRSHGKLVAAKTMTMPFVFAPIEASSPVPASEVLA